MQRDNDINQSNEAGSGYASAASNPQMFKFGKSRKPPNLGMEGPNKTRFTPFNIIANKVSQNALPDNRWRNYLMFQNNSAADIFIGFGIHVGESGENGFTVGGGGFYEVDIRVPFNAIYIASVADGSKLLIIEGAIDRAQIKGK